MMTQFMIGLWTVLAVGAVIAVGIVGVRLSRTTKRISRSIDPINQKAKGLKLELSALKRSRLDRQRRLKASSSSESEK